MMCLSVAEPACIRWCCCSAAAATWKDKVVQGHLQVVQRDMHFDRDRGHFAPPPETISTVYRSSSNSNPVSVYTQKALFACP